MAAEIQNDSKVAENRKSPLAGVKVSLRDQIPQKLMDSLNEKDWGEKVVSCWLRGNANRTEWLVRQQEFLQDWDEFLESTAEGPFEGSSTLHVPMTLIVCKAMHARYMQALFGVEPYCTTKARTAAFMDRSELVQNLMHYTLKKWMNFRRGVYPVADSWVWSWLTTGVGILKSRWATKYLRYVDVVKEKRQLTPAFVRGQGGGREHVIPQFQEVEVEKLVQKKVFEGPCADFKFPEDVLIIGGDGDPQLADSVTEFEPMTASELWTLADQGIFDADAVKECIKGGPDVLAGQVNSAIKHQRVRNAGKATVSPSTELDRYHILEDYRSIDVDGSGINTEVVMWVHQRSMKILRATYLHRINQAGERPFFKIDFHKRAGQDYGVGIVELMHSLSVELDAHRNMRVDFGMVATLPFGFYRPTSSINPVQVSLSPGQLIPCDNPHEDVYFPNLGNRTAFGFQEEQSIQTWIERLTGINDLSTGVMTGAQGATRTASGTRALLGESNSNISAHLKRLNLGWEQFLSYNLHMLQQRLPKGFEFRVTGEHGDEYFEKIQSSDDIGGDYDFELSGNSETSNPMIQQQNAQQVLQVVTNPLYIQIGAVNVGNIYEAIKSFYKSLGIKDWGKYVSKPPDYMYIMSPEEECNAILRGIEVPVMPHSDHDGFQAYFKEILDNDELLGQFDANGAKLLKAQSVKHEQMKQALQHAQAQAANMQQQRQNASDVQIANGPGVNPMPGPGPVYTPTGNEGGGGQ